MLAGPVRLLLVASEVEAADGAGGEAVTVKSLSGPSTVGAMDSVPARGHRCEVCDWTFRPGTDLEQHNSGLVHRTLLDAFERLTPDRFQAFRDAVISTARTRGKYQLKRELRAAPQVSLVSQPSCVYSIFYPEACCSLDEDTVDFLDRQCLSSASRHPVRVFPLLPERQQKTRDADCVEWFAPVFGKIHVRLSTPSVGS